jgi:hypothetical protein
MIRQTQRCHIGGALNGRVRDALSTPGFVTNRIRRCFLPDIRKRSIKGFLSTHIKQRVDLMETFNPSIRSPSIGAPLPRWIGQNAHRATPHNPRIKRERRIV